MRNVITHLMAASLCAPLAAEIRVVTDGPLSIHEGATVRLWAEVQGALPQPELAWSIVQDQGGTLAMETHHWMRYTAPLLASPEAAFQVRVAPRDGSHPEKLITIQVRSFRQRLNGLRLDLLAGDPKASGMVLGSGAAARFGEITHLARLDGHPDPKLAGRCVLVDRLNNRILLMEEDGWVRSWLGSPDGKPGHACGRGDQARFRSPRAFVVRPRTKDEPWQAVITDTGNHRVLRVDEKGEVSVLAGAHDNWGQHDGEGPAVFRAPEGAAYLPDGTLCVTDSENGVILRLRDGKATILAGRTQAPGWDDGKADGARFQRPGAIVLEPRTGHLLVADADRVREVSKDGTVRTRIGAPQHGFEAQLASVPASAGADRLTGVPCLNGISGLAVVDDHLLITESGNRALRHFDPFTGSLVTVAGHPDRAEFRPGLAGSGRELPGTEAASLTSATHVLLDPDGSRGLVAMRLPYGGGSCVARLSRAATVSDRADSKESKSGTAAPSAPEGARVELPAPVESKRDTSGLVESKGAASVPVESRSSELSPIPEGAADGALVLDVAEAD